jgi:hypothetical protein
MRRIGALPVLILALVVALGLSSYAIANGGKKNLKADGLTGLQENPDISTMASGSLKLTLDDDAQTISYELTYSGLEGTVTQSHIHFSKRAVNGPIIVWLCGTTTNPGPAGTPTCPAAPGGTVTRTLTAADIQASGAAQGIEAANYTEFAAALRAGHAYGNVHSTKWPGGEIRAQINDRDADN